MAYNTLPPCSSGRYWRIRAGDTLFKIAVQISSTVKAIQRLNPGIDPDNLQAGQVICIPLQAPCPSGVFWEVASGDSFYKIARQAGTTVQRLMELNPDVDPFNLQIGQKICLP